MADTTAVIYARISRDRAGAGLGIDRQLEDCRTLADRLGYTIAAEHADNDISAYTGKPRPGYTAALELIEAGHAQAIVCWHLDRLTRSPRDLETIVDLCEQHSATVHQAQAGDLDLSSPSGRMVARMLGAAARHEIEHSIERQRRAKAQAAAAGKFRGGRRPFGYDADGVTVRLDEARILRDATQAVIDGASIRAICRDWNVRGVTSTMGNSGHWRSNDLRRLLLRARNAGLIEHDGTITGKASWPAIVDEDAWNTCRLILTDPARSTTPGPSRRWLGSGLYMCGPCGHAVHPQGTTRAKNGVSRVAYTCGNGTHVSRDANHLDTYVTDTVLNWITTAGNTLFDDEPTPDVTQLRLDLMTLRRQLDDLALECSDGTISARQLGIASAPLQQRIDTLERALADATAKRNPALARLTGDPVAAWDDMSIEDRQQVVALFGQVRLWPGRTGRQPGGGYFDYATIELLPRQR